jgi:hypothetical protein
MTEEEFHEFHFDGEELKSKTTVPYLIVDRICDCAEHITMIVCIAFALIKWILF